MELRLNPDKIGSDQPGKALKISPTYTWLMGDYQYL